MRRGPDEDDGEEHDRRPREAAGHRRPPDEDRDGSGGPADHDVLRRSALEPQGVDEDVEQGGRHGQGRREEVHGQPEFDEGGRLERQGEDQGRPRRHGPGHQRTVLGAVHQTVDVAVHHHVDGVGPPGGQGATGQRRRHQPQRRKPVLRHHHGGQGRDQQQLDDARLGEGDVRANGRPRGGLNPKGGSLGGHFAQPTTRCPL